VLRTPLRALSGHSGVVIAADWLPGGEQVSNISAISTKKCLEYTINHDFYNIPILHTCKYSKVLHVSVRIL